MIKEINKAAHDRERADYIFEVAGSLAAIAREGEMGMLAYILDMARLEARHHIEPESEKSGTHSDG